MKSDLQTEKGQKAFGLMKSFAYYAKQFAQSTGDTVKKNKHQHTPVVCKNVNLSSMLLAFGEWLK